MVWLEEGYRKVLIIFGFLFIAVSAIQLFTIYLLMTTTINLYGKKMLFQDFIFNSTFVPLSGSLLFIFIIITVIFFLIVGILLLKISSKKIIDNTLRAKSMLMLGVLILIFSFVKLGYITFLNRTEINIGSEFRTFQHIIYSSNFGPFYIVIIWLFFIGVVCFYLMSGLVFGGLGLHWTLELQKQEEEN
ncbi:MAG: hypothetical protein ACFFDN_42765 [Candidatus Hodarchaeota archaeon]